MNRARLPIGPRGAGLARAAAAAAVAVLLLAVLTTAAAPPAATTFDDAHGGGTPSDTTHQAPSGRPRAGALPLGRAGRGPGHGLAPLPRSQAVPLSWLPPGTDSSPSPSEVVFPAQTLTLRFNHHLHVVELGQSCRVCHAAAWQSTRAADRLLPDPATTCDNCHDVDHRRRDAVVAGSEANGRCSYCHLVRPADHGARRTIARTVIPPPHLKMDHRVHLARDIRCPHCHGTVDRIELATRQQLPRMAGCFSCHAMSGAARGRARGACTTCHPATPTGTMATEFASGTLRPPRWLHGAQHTPDWLSRHKLVAAANSPLCASCHAERFCSDCHDGRVRPRSVHPGDYLSMHPVAARQDSPRCVSCHQLQSFCGDCHRRVGVARDAPSGNRAANRRFHPPPSAWTTGPRGPQHHAWQAQRNLNACVSCHSERDCATCHATKGLRGGAGVDPHPPGFETSCASAFRRNPRPCLVCHPSGDAELSRCR